jgi:hypothetical protein
MPLAAIVAMVVTAAVVLLGAIGFMIDKSADDGAAHQPKENR